MINKEAIENLKVRFLKDEDMPFIYNSFLKSCQHGFKTMSAQLYFNQMKLVLIELLKVSNILVVHLNNEPDKIIGYVISHRNNDIFCLHYVYIKHVFRNLGIAKTLLKAAGYNKEEESGFATLPTKPNDKNFYRKMNLTYNPLVLYKGVELEEESDEAN